MTRILSRHVVATLGISLLLSCPSCTLKPTPHELLVQEIRGIYADTFKQVKPGFVMITYEDSVEALTANQQVEYATVTGLLDELGIEWEARRFGLVWTQFDGQKPGTRYNTYDLPLGVAERHEGKVVTRTMLLENVWDLHFDPQTNVVDTQISRLRAKIDRDFDQPLLHTLRGRGYRLGGHA